MHNVTLHDDRNVTVPVVDFPESMRSILNDPEVMKHIMKELDGTWRPITSTEEHESNEEAVINDKASGWLYRQGIDLHCPSTEACDPTKVRPFPVIMHIDKSHSDLFGNLAVAPIQVMPAMLDVDIQQHSKAWRQISTIPNLSAGKGKDGKKNKNSFAKLQDYHKVLGVALSSFTKCYEDGGFYWKDPEGNDILLKPYIHMIIGDIAGVNEMVGHYNTSHANCVVKDCKCNHEQLLSFPPVCHQVKWNDIQECETVEEIFKMYHDKGLVSEAEMSEVMKDVTTLDKQGKKDLKSYQKSISKHPVENAFDKLPLADPYQGVIGITPQEMLHLMGAGIYKYLLLGIRDIIGMGDKNSSVKGLVNDIFPDIKLHLQRNSCKDVPRMSNRNGFFNVTCLTSEEARGNFFGLVLFMHTTYGRGILSHFFVEKGVNYDDMLETCCLVLGWERFFVSPQTRADYKAAEYVTWDLQSRIARDIPRPEYQGEGKKAGSKGWKIAKFHALGFLSALVQKFGSAKTFDSAANEKHHKDFVKANAKLTQRISSLFAAQLSRNDHDRVVIDRVYEYIKPYCSQDFSPKADVNVTGDDAGQWSDSDMEDDDDGEVDSDDEQPLGVSTSAISVFGKYDLSIKINAQKRITSTHRWHSYQRRLLGISPNHFVIKTVSDALIKYYTQHNISGPSSVDVVGYTRITVGGHCFRSNPYWKGSEWYDYATVKFPSTVAPYSEGGDICICRIMGFITYLSRGAITYGNMELDGRSPQDVAQEQDSRIYAILHCQHRYFSFTRLEQQFLRKFVMAGSNDMYILPVTCLVKPLLVIPDIKDHDSASSTRYIVCLPRHMFGLYFKHHVHSYNEDDKDEESLDSDYEDEW